MLMNAQKELSKQGKTGQGQSKYGFNRTTQNSGVSNTYKNFLTRKPNQAGYPPQKLGKVPQAGGSYKYGPTLPAFKSGQGSSGYGQSVPYKPNYLSSSKQYQSKQTSSKTQLQAVST